MQQSYLPYDPYGLNIKKKNDLMIYLFLSHSLSLSLSLLLLGFLTISFYPSLYKDSTKDNSYTNIHQLSYKVVNYHETTTVD